MTALGLIGLGAEDAIPALKGLANSDPDGEVRHAAHEAIDRIVGKPT